MPGCAAILKVDPGGRPMRWISVEEAATVIVSGRMLWSYGNKVTTLRGGLDRSGRRSTLDIPGILAVVGSSHVWQRFSAPLCNRLLFRRDHSLCLYCGEQFSYRDLTRDHVEPRGLGGRDCWTNVVTACRRCNLRKGCRTPTEAGMPLLAVPYEPNLHEWMFLANHAILADQMDFLKPGFKHIAH